MQGLDITNSYSLVFVFWNCAYVAVLIAALWGKRLTGHLRLLHASPGTLSAFMGDVATYTGVATMGMMMLAPFVFTKVGWGAAASFTPQFLFAGRRPGTLATVDVFQLILFQQAMSNLLVAGSNKIEIKIFHDFMDRGKGDCVLSQRRSMLYLPLRLPVGRDMKVYAVVGADMGPTSNVTIGACDSCENDGTASAHVC